MKKMLHLIRHEIKKGTDVKSVSRAILLGMWMGLCPLFGVTTALCAFIAVRLKVNQALIQMVNYAMSPIQVLMIPGYLVLSSRILSLPSPSLEMITESLLKSPFQLIQDFIPLFAFSFLIWIVLGGVIFALIDLFLLKWLLKGSFQSKG